MFWVQCVDVEFPADVFRAIGPQDIEGESSKSGEVSWLGSDATLIFEKADVTDVVIAVFDAPMLPDGVTDGRGGQGDLAGIEGYFAGPLPELGFGIFAPGVACDANGSFDQVTPV